MLVLLSSGATRRYRDDIIRILALPEGGELQFRYDRRYIDSELLKRVDTGNVRDEEGLVLYLWSDKTKLATAFVPCRFVTVVSTEFAGSACIIRLRARGFVKDLDDAQFRGSLDDKERKLLPTWEPKPGAEPVQNGKFFFPIAATLKANHTNDFVGFERAAFALVQYKDFTDPQSTVFYSVRRVIEIRERQARGSSAAGIQASAGYYELQSGEAYEVEVYSLVPRPAELKTSKLHMDSDVELIEFPLGNYREIDSRYDLKRVPFHVPEQLQTISAGLHFYLSGPEDQDNPHSDIMIPVRFRGSLLYAMIRVLLVGIGTAGSGMVAANAADKLNFGNAVLMIFLGIVAAMGTVFTSLKKS